MFDVLLTEYPNYSAREVRRLAKQVRYLSGLNSKDAKGIADELMELTIFKAKTEAQLADTAAPLSQEQIKRVVDDLKAKIVVPSQVPKIEADLLYGEGKWEYLTKIKSGDYELERLSVTPHSRAVAAIHQIQAAMEANLPDTPSPLLVAIQSAMGMVNGPSFYTDKVIMRMKGADHD